jgi:hypothetical protein
MNLAQARTYALSLPRVTEAPHHKYSSFRVAGRIFATVPPDGGHLHVFVDEVEREYALALAPTAYARLAWGEAVVGLRIVLAEAKAPAVTRLLHCAWLRKAPRKLVDADAAAKP